MKILLRTLVLLALLASPALADLRAITGDLDDALGEPANGTMVISWPAYTSVGGVFKPPSRRVISVSEGTYTAFSLDSSQDASPAFSYTVQYNFGAAPPARACSWSIAAGSSSVAITAIQTCPAVPSSPASSIGYTTITGLTAGAVTFGGSGGALTQDATAFYWDETNNRLGIGTTSFVGSEKLRVVSTGNNYIRVNAGSGNFFSGVAVFSGDGGGASANATVDVGHGSTVKWQTGLLNGSSDFTFLDSDTGPNTQVMCLDDTTFNVIIGTTCVAAGYLLDVQKSGSAGTARFYDQTASTGVTNIAVRAGAGQSSTDMVQFRNNADALLSTISSNGAFGWASSGDFKVQVGGGPGVFIASDTALQFNSAVSLSSGAADTGLCRNAAGILEINNGSCGTYRDLRLRNLILTSTAAIDATLANSQCSMHLTSNTNFQIRCKGSDATVRFADITLAP